MIYNFSIYIYGALIKFAALWNSKAKKWVNGRTNYWETLPDIPEEKDLIWFHCASMGEYDQGLPVMEEFKKLNPNSYLLITFFSPSGYEALINKSIGDFTCYLPLDTPNNAVKFISHFKPSKAFFVKYEFWLNYIDACDRMNCKLYGLSAVFKADQRFFKWYGGRFKSMINKFDHLFLQNEMSATVLSRYGFSNYTVTGDTRYDRVVSRAKENGSNKILDQLKRAQNKNVFVIGSSWPKDEELIIPLINNGEIEDTVILAPHEVNQSHIKEIEKRLEVPYQKYTDLENGESVNIETKVVLLNCIGVLANAYKYGNIAYVGGGFGTGLHNILEPASFGLPVIFGPQHEKFPEAQDFIQNKIGISVDNPTSFIEAYTTLTSKNSVESDVLEFIRSKVGATQEVMNYFQ